MIVHFKKKSSPIYAQHVTDNVHTTVLIKTNIQ